MATTTSALADINTGNLLAAQGKIAEAIKDIGIKREQILRQALVAFINASTTVVDPAAALNSYKNIQDQQRVFDEQVTALNWFGSQLSGFVDKLKQSSPQELLDAARKQQSGLGACRELYDELQKLIAELEKTLSPKTKAG
jgi:hypothetical protein